MNDDFFQYDCLSEGFYIKNWFHKYSNEPSHVIQNILQNKSLGPGYLYQMFFRRYDILVSYSKLGYKSRRNSVQRTTSQMRSGVPVLLDCRGESHGELCTKYSYDCGFTDEKSFYRMLNLMKNVDLRRKCQEAGLLITSKSCDVVVDIT